MAEETNTSRKPQTFHQTIHCINEGLQKIGMTMSALGPMPDTSAIAEEADVLACWAKAFAGQLTQQAAGQGTAIRGEINKRRAAILDEAGTKLHALADAMRAVPLVDITDAKAVLAWQPSSGFAAQLHDETEDQALDRLAIVAADANKAAVLKAYGSWQEGWGDADA